MAIYIPASVKYICCFGCVCVATFLLMCNSGNMTLKSTLKNMAHLLKKKKQTNKNTKLLRKYHAFEHCNTDFLF